MDGRGNVTRQAARCLEVVALAVSWAEVVVVGVAALGAVEGAGWRNQNTHRKNYEKSVAVAVQGKPMSYKNASTTASHIARTTRRALRCILLSLVFVKKRRIPRKTDVVKKMLNNGFS